MISKKKNSGANGLEYEGPGLETKFLRERSNLDDVALGGTGVI